MSAVLGALIDRANRTGRPAPEVVRLHVLEAALRRVGGDAAFALRGSMLTRHLAAPFPRPAADLDFAGTAPAGVAEIAGRFFAQLAADCGDEVRFEIDRCSAKGIWEQTAFPGVRLALTATAFDTEHATTVDIGFGDPLVPPAGRIEYATLAGPPAQVWAVHPATLAAWKLHGLAEWGRVRWRPKDLLDLGLLTERFAFPAELMADALRAAFVSRGYDPAAARRTIDDPGRWASPAVRGRWAAFRREWPAVPVPESAAAVAATIAVRLAPAFDRLA